MNPTQDNTSELVARYKAELGTLTELVEPSMHVFARLLELQKLGGIAGDMMEMGVFRAGTAALLATGLEEKERLFLIDPTQDAVRNRQTIESFAGVRSEQLTFH